MFYKDCLPVIRRDDLCALTKCIASEIKLGKKSIFFNCNYRSPSQTIAKIFTEHYQISPFYSKVIGDFNVRCRKLVDRRCKFKPW